MCVYLSICLLQMVGSGPGVAGGVGMGKLETKRQKVERGGRVPVGAGPAVVFHSFAVGGRGGASGARGIAAYGAVSRMGGCVGEPAAGCDEDRDD